MESNYSSCESEMALHMMHDDQKLDTDGGMQRIVESDLDTGLILKKM